MKLNKDVLKKGELLQKQGYALPTFEMEKVVQATAQNPDWVHFGAGNIFRAFLANVGQLLLNEQKRDKGIVTVEGFDYEIVERIYQPHDNLGLLAILNADGSVEKTIVGSVTEALKADAEDAQHWTRLQQAFASPSLQMASFTITEKGYSLQNSAGEYAPLVQADFAAGPKAPQSYIGKVVSLLHHRYVNGAMPLALVSMDNCSANGEKLQTAVETYVEQWCAAGLCDAGFKQYVQDPAKVGFPWTMIDKITPRPDAKVQELFEQDGFEEMAPIITGKNTYIAPFVNAEKPQYLVMEDWFPAGKPLVAGHGVYYTDREHVSKVETMKVTTCLNPLHTALAVFGCLLGYDLIADEMKDDDLKKMVYRLGYTEGLPVVVDPEILSPKEFIDEVITVRIPNPFMPDTPQRIATDTSQKLAIRYGETIKKYHEKGLDMNTLQVVPLVLAGWLRYLLAVDDEGQVFDLSPDPRGEEMRQRMQGIEFGKPADYHAVLQPILSDKSIFGVNLYEVDLGEKVEALFGEMVAGAGAVRKTIVQNTD